MQQGPRLSRVKAGPACFLHPHPTPPPSWLLLAPSLAAFPQRVIVSGLGSWGRFSGTETRRWGAAGCSALCGLRHPAVGGG